MMRGQDPMPCYNPGGYNRLQSMAEVRKIFAQNLRHLLREQKLSQAQFAKKLNTDQAKIHKWCNAISWPEPESIDDICRVLDVSPSALFIDPTDEREKKVWSDARLQNVDTETAYRVIGDALGIKPKPTFDRSGKSGG